MDVTIKLSRDFERCLEDLRRKYGEDFEYLNGIHPSQLDHSSFLDNFVKNDTLADTTVDPNANANHRDIRSFIIEKGKSEDKLFGLNKVFYEMKKKWGLKAAREWLEQEFSRGFYLNDATTVSYFAYCYATDLTRLAKEGLFFLKGYNNQPPKHLTTFLDAVIEFVSFLCNRQSGAVGLPNIIIWCYYFWKHDVENGYYIKNPDYYLRQCYQKLIYRLNQPFLRLDQTSFTNVSIFDREYLESLFGGVEYPDGSFVIDEIENIIDAQKIFMEVVSEIRKECMFTFPILTYSLLYKDGEFKDAEFARWCSDHNTKWQDSNFFLSDNVGVLSNCPLRGDTKILYYTDKDGFAIAPIKDIYDACQKGNKTIEVLNAGQKVKCKVNQFEDSANYRIELVNGAVIYTTADHLNKVYGKDYVKTEDLTKQDYLPFSLIAYEGNSELTYEQGYVVGQDIYTEAGDSASELTKQFMTGTGPSTRGINPRVIEYSKDFRNGILDGLFIEDADVSAHVYTSSETLKDSIVALCASLGIVTAVTEDYQEGDNGKGVLYCIRRQLGDTKPKAKEAYKTEGDYTWIKIKEIKKAKATDVAYCLEVVKKDVLAEFMLGNGIITHNCRLLSDTSKLGAFINSIGGTALSIGSCRVSTINLVRIAYETNFKEEDYLKLLREKTILDCKALYTMRHILKRNIEKGLLPNYTDGAVELDKQYCTIGILGTFEVMDLFGYIRTDEFGNKYYTDEAMAFAEKIFDVINDVKDHFTDEFTYNIESIPAENCAGVICQADNLLFNTDRYFIYSNQWIPLMEKCTIQEKCRVSAVLDRKCSGGAISHIDIEGQFPNKDVAWDLLNYVAKSGVIYMAFTTKIGVCEDRHASIGTKTCPHCGKPIIDQYARVVGFYTPVSSYQKIRKKEFNARKWYDVVSKDVTMR